MFASLTLGVRSIGEYRIQTDADLFVDIYTKAIFLSTTRIMTGTRRIRQTLPVGPQAWGLYQSNPQWWVDFGIKKSFLEDKLDVTLKINDIFRSRWLEADSNICENINELRQYRSNQSIGINLRYRFSKGKKVDVQEKGIELEELDRTATSN